MKTVRDWMFGFLFLFFCVVPASAATTVAAVGDASISHDAQAGTTAPNRPNTDLTGRICRDTISGQF